MTDLEISKALALAIGWHKDKVAIHNDMWEVMVQKEPNPFGWRVFNHMDWNVIGPIAEKFECFPTPSGQPEKKGQWYSPVGLIYNAVYADTPQRAIAMAVIQGAKK